MKSTYARAMTGSRITAPAIKRRWVYLLVALLLICSALFAREEARRLLTEPIGVAVWISLAAGFLLRRSTALIPWGLVSAAVIAYGIDRHIGTSNALFPIAEVVLVAAAVVVYVFQLKVDLGGHAADRPGRTRWGSVLVAATSCLVVLVLSRPDVLLVEWIRGKPASSIAPAISKGRYGTPSKVGRFSDAAITESSGLAASRLHAGVLWTHNDSGGQPYLFCFRARGGASCGTWQVSGATNRDWEDIAIGPGPEPGRDYLYIGDIGDNETARKTITVYRVPEPEAVGLSAGSTSTEQAVSLELIYPDGAHDAETLMVEPRTGDLYVVTKGTDSAVYRARLPLTGDRGRLQKVSDFSIFATLSDLTGGDISPDGTRVAISTYGGWYELALDRRSSSGPADLSSTSFWSVTPSLVGRTPPGQWEAIAYGADGRSLYMTSEGRRAPIYMSEMRSR